MDWPPNWTGAGNGLFCPLEPNENTGAVCPNDVAVVVVVVETDVLPNAKADAVVTEVLPKVKVDVVAATVVTDVLPKVNADVVEAAVFPNVNAETVEVSAFNPVEDCSPKLAVVAPKIGTVWPKVDDGITDDD